jgi:16S rRNA (guanine527-N7)-methyltransferase
LRDERVERWLTALVETPGLTAVADLAAARRLHVDEALEAASLIEHGPVVDVGSGGGSPGIPLAAARPELQFDLLESSRRKCDFLRRWADEFENVSVVCARAEEHARGTGREAYGTAVARALAPPAVAAEWCLPLLRAGGRAILFVGPTVDRAAVATISPLLAAGVDAGPAGFLLLRKVGATPDRFPRRPGIARKRPLA